MAGTRVHYDHSALTHVLEELAQTTSSESLARAGLRPHVPATAVGRDFTDRAARLQEVLDAVHRVGQRRVDLVTAAAKSGASQVAAFTQTDGEIARTMTGAER